MCSAALPFNASFLFPFFRSAGARGGGRGFRLPLPRSGLPLPKFSARAAARLKIWTAVLLRLANFPSGRRCALVKIGALRQTQLPVSSTGRGRCVCPCSASAVSAAGSASASQPLDSLPTLTTSPLALSRFLRRAAEGACKNRSAAPASARLFRPLDAPGQSCPGPKRSGRSGQKPKKTRRPWPVKTSSAYKRRPGFFLTAFTRRSDW